MIFFLSLTIKLVKDGQPCLPYHFYTAPLQQNNTMSHRSKNDDRFASAFGSASSQVGKIIGAGGFLIPDQTQRSSVSQSTSERRARTQPRFATQQRWNKSHRRVETQTHLVASTEDDQKTLLPHFAIGLVMTIKSREDMQRYINELNNKNYNVDDPHICTNDKPCQCFLKRVNTKGEPDGTAGLHVVAFNPFTYEFIIPSRHHNLLEEWKKTERKSYPLCGFDHRILQQKSVQDCLKLYQQPKGSDKKLYIFANLFGGDSPGPKIPKYPFNIQLPRGNLDPIDAINAGIKKKISNSDPIDLINAARYAVCREMVEESDGVLIADSTFRDELQVIYDLRQDNPVKQTKYRGVVFGIVINDIYRLVNPKRVVTHHT